MIDLSLLSEQSYGGFFVASMAVIAVAISKAGFGGAMASLSAPIMLLAFTPSQSLGVLLPLFLVADIWVVWFWRHLGVRRIIIVMTVTALFGQFIGWLMLHYGALDDRWLMFFIGVMALLTSGKYLLTQLGSLAVTSRQKALVRVYRRHILSRALLWCTLSGFTSFVSLTGGITSQIYLLPLQLPRQLFVATMAWFFLFINLAKVPFFTELAFMSSATWTYSILLLPFVPIGIVVGRWLNQVMSDRFFYIAVHILLGILGMQLIMRFVQGV